MINQQILDYIKQQVQQGVSREQIKSSLMTNGWQSVDVEEAFNLINTQGQLSQSDIAYRPKSFNKTAFLAIIVIGVLVIGGGVMGYFAFVGRDKMAIPPSSVSLNPPLTETPVSTSSPATTETPVPATPSPVVIKPTPTVTPKPTPALTNPTPPPTPSPVSSKIDSCRTISTAGEYSLSGNLTNTKSEPCIKIQNVSNVSLDCQNYTITSKNENYNIYIKASTDFKINNCKLTSIVSLPSASAQHVLKIEDSKQGEVVNNTVGGNYATISGSSFVTARNNTFNTQFNVYKSNNVTLKDNNFNFAGGAVIIFQEGNNNSLISNILDGKSDGVFENKNGTDDIVFIDNEDNDVIQGNTLQNAYECAIEFNRVSGVKIIGNKVNNTGLSFLCGWHYVSAKGITVKDNTVNNSPSLFWFFRERALRSDEPYVYFQNNLFENNKLSNPKTGTGFSFAAMIDFNRSIVPLQNYRISNNVLRNNDFTKLVGILRLAPGSVVIDGGGNICSGAEEEAKGGGDSIPFNCN